MNIKIAALCAALLAAAGQANACSVSREVLDADSQSSGKRFDTARCEWVDRDNLPVDPLLQRPLRAAAPAQQPQLESQPKGYVVSPNRLGASTPRLR